MTFFPFHAIKNKQDINIPILIKKQEKEEFKFMDIRFQPKELWKSDIVLFFTFEDESLESIEKRHEYLFQSASWLTIAPAWRDFTGKANSSLLLYGHKDNEISRAIAIGLGKKEKFSMSAFRDALASAVKSCKSLNIEHLALDVSSLKALLDTKDLVETRVKNKNTLEYLVEEATFAALISLYSFDTFKSKSENNDKKPEIFTLFIDEASIPDNLRNAARLAEASYKGVKLSRDLANAPANILTPTAFADKAEEIAKKHDFKCTILDGKALTDLNMNAFMAVAKGSRQDPRLIILEYTPKNCTETKPYVFVGKGITFDTGGISLKPSKGMEDMKTDMSGAGDLLGLMEILGQSKLVREPNRPIIVLLACAENMPDGIATRPGDIVTAYNGKTVEITNTDAEGRLVLIDSLAYAIEKYKPEIIMDIATLTGACVVALGDEAAGFFANNNKLSHDIFNCAERTGETMWRLPLWDFMLKKMKSHVADLDNAGSRDGGTITAAVFIQEFVEEGQKWAHLDIAGPSSSSSDKPLFTKGGTGFGTRLLHDFIYNS